MDISEIACKMGSDLKKIRINVMQDPQKTMAIRVGVSLATYAKMEKGDASISLATWLAAAKVTRNINKWGTLFSGESLFDQRPPASQRMRVRK